MTYLFFTKTLRETGVEQLPDVLKGIGADGADLCVRPGYPVHPGNAREELKKAVRRLEEAGLAVPMISAPTDLSSPEHRDAEALFAACHDAQVPCLKPGYWPFRSGPYKAQLDAARKDVEGWQRLAERYGVRCCIHVHSGSFLTVNTAAALLIVEDTDPSRIGLYLDPGHLALNGEPPSMAVSMAGERLAIVAAKDYLSERTGDARVRRNRCVPLGEGFVNWAEWWRCLREARFQGPVSIHSEYDGLTHDQMLEQARKDIAYLRALG